MCTNDAMVVSAFDPPDSKPIGVRLMLGMIGIIWKTIFFEIGLGKK